MHKLGKECTNWVTRMKELGNRHVLLLKVKWQLGVWALREWWRYQKVEQWCESAGSNSMEDIIACICYYTTVCRRVPQAREARVVGRDDILLMLLWDLHVLRCISGWAAGVFRLVIAFSDRALVFLQLATTWTNSWNSRSEQACFRFPSGQTHKRKNGHVTSSSHFTTQCISEWD